MSDVKWAWTRINILIDGSVQALPINYVTARMALRERKQLRAGYSGWKVLSEKTNWSRRILAMNEKPTWDTSVALTFVFYEKRKVNDAE